MYLCKVLKVSLVDLDGCRAGQSSSSKCVCVFAFYRVVPAEAITVKLFCYAKHVRATINEEMHRFSRFLFVTNAQHPWTNRDQAELISILNHLFDGGHW